MLTFFGHLFQQENRAVDLLTQCQGHAGDLARHVSPAAGYRFDGKRHARVRTREACANGLLELIHRKADVEGQEVFAYHLVAP
jgi:hypothetical protein